MQPAAVHPGIFQNGYGTHIFHHTHKIFYMVRGKLDILKIDPKDNIAAAFKFF